MSVIYKNTPLACRFWGHQSKRKLHSDIAENKKRFSKGSFTQISCDHKWMKINIYLPVRPPSRLLVTEKQKRHLLACAIWHNMCNMDIFYELSLTLHQTPLDWPWLYRTRWFPASPFLLDPCEETEIVYLSELEDLVLHDKRMTQCRVGSPPLNKRMKTFTGAHCKPFNKRARVAYRVVDARWVSSSFSRPSTERPRFSLLLASRGVNW